MGGHPATPPHARKDPMTDDPNGARTKRGPPVAASRGGPRVSAAPSDLTALGTLLPVAGLTRTRSRAWGWAPARSLPRQPGARRVPRAHPGPAQLRPGHREQHPLPARPHPRPCGRRLHLVRLDHRDRRPGPTPATRPRAHAVARRLHHPHGRPRRRSLAYKGAEFALIGRDTVGVIFKDSPLSPGQGAQVVEGEDPWAETPSGQHPAPRLRRRGRPRRHPDRLDDRRQHRHEDRPNGADLPATQPPAGAAARDEQAARLVAGRHLRRAQLPRQESDANDPCMLNSIWSEVDQFRISTPTPSPATMPPGAPRPATSSARSSASRSTTRSSSTSRASPTDQRHGRRDHQCQARRL